MIKKMMIAVLLTGTLMVTVSADSEAEAGKASQRSGASPRLSGDKPWCSTPDSKQPGKSGNASCNWDTYEACMRGKGTNDFCYSQSEINK